MIWNAFNLYIKVSQKFSSCGLGSLSAIDFKSSSILPNLSCCYKVKPLLLKFFLFFNKNLTNSGLQKDWKNLKWKENWNYLNDSIVKSTIILSRVLKYLKGLLILDPQWKLQIMTDVKIHWVQNNEHIFFL